MSDIYSTSSDALTRDWKLIELHGVSPAGYCSCGNTSPEHRSQAGKHPTDRGWTKDERAFLGESKLFQLFSDDPLCAEDRPSRNYGVVTGELSNVWVLDIDPDHDGFDRLNELIDQYGDLPDTFTVETGSGGAHLYFCFDPERPVTNSRGLLPVGIDVRGNGGMVVAAGSTSAKGHYSIAAGDDVVDAPQWLYDLVLPPKKPLIARKGDTVTDTSVLRSYVDAALKSECEAIRTAPDGDQNNAINRAAFNMGTMVANYPVTAEEIADALLDAAVAGGHPASRAVRTIESGVRGGIDSPRDLPELKSHEMGGVDFDPWSEGLDGEEFFLDSSDEMLARRFAHHYDRGRGFVWSKDEKRFLRWDGTRWVRESHSIIPTGALRDAVEKEKRFVPEFPEDEKSPEYKRVEKMHRAYSKALYAASSERTRRNVEAAYSSLPGVAVETSEFDSRVHLLNLQNGTYDMLSGVFRDAKQEDYITTVMGTSYDPDATCPQWEAHLQRVLPDPEMRELLRRMVAYTLTGNPNQRAMPVLVGPPGTGKSVTVEIIGELFGECGSAAAEDLFFSRDTGGGENLALHSVKGKRLAAVSEGRKGAQLNTSLVKRLTGGDQVTSRGHYESLQTWKPILVPWLATNYMPRLGGDEAALQRLYPIDFTVDMRGAGEDTHIKEKLRAELPGILNWALARVSVVNQPGALDKPEQLMKRIEQERLNQDVVEQWVAARNEAGVVSFHEDAVMQVSDAYQDFKLWWEREIGGDAERPLSVRAFSDRMSERAEVTRTTYTSRDGRFPRGRSVLTGFEVRTDVRSAIQGG